LYLLDTNIVSADAPAKRAIGPGTFAAWIRRNGERLFISTITIAEIEAGIARAVRIGATTKSERLRRRNNCHRERAERHLGLFEGTTGVAGRTGAP